MAYEYNKPATPQSTTVLRPVPNAFECTKESVPPSNRGFAASLANAGLPDPAIRPLLSNITSGTSEPELHNAYVLYLVDRMRGPVGSDREGRVFGLANLTWTIESKEGGVGNLNSLVEGLVEFAIHILTSLSSPALLAAREDDGEGRNAKLPSWVPDFSVKNGSGTPLSWRQHYGACGANTYPKREPFTSQLDVETGC
jgi:hypothetical protein